jgi:hypothetical protein
MTDSPVQPSDSNNKAGPRPAWRSSFDPDSRLNSEISRRSFLKCAGGATASTIVAWQGLTLVTRAEVGGSGA